MADPLTVAGVLDGTLAVLLFELAHPTVLARANATANLNVDCMETSTGAERAV